MTQFSSDEAYSQGKKVYDLSIGQKELWFIHSIGGLAQSAYNEPLVYSLSGLIKPELLNKAFNLLLEKHDSLRTSFIQDDHGSVHQCVLDKAVLNLCVLELSEQNEIKRYINSFIQYPFDLKNAPLIRVALIKERKDKHKLVIVLHHIITDGTSFGILVRDLNHIYQLLLAGEFINVEYHAQQYRLQVLAEKENETSVTYKDQASQFAQSLEGYSTLNFLTTPIADKSRDLFSGNRIYFKLDCDLLKKVKEVAKKKRATPFHLLFATYSWLITQYTRSNDVVIGVPFANRQADPEQDIIGYFINTMPIRQQLHANQSFLDYLVEVKKAIFAHLCHQNVAFEHIAQQLKLERKALGQHPIIQTLFVWGALDKLQLKLPGIESLIEKEYHNHTSKFDISLFMLEENKESVTGYFEYRDALFEHEMMEAFARSFIVLLENVVQSPEAKLADLTLLNDKEQAWMRDYFFTSKLDRVVKQSLVDLFAETVACYPNRTGLIFDGKHYDYLTLDSKSNQWACYIRYQYFHHYGKELDADTLIALCIDRNEDMIFGILGILKAGAAYVPVDPQYPVERMNYILSHSQSSLLLTHKQYDTLCLNFPTDKIIYMDDENIPHSEFFLDKTIPHQTKPQDIAYVLYTSGSTGQPKGVAVTHENVNCLFTSLDKPFDLSEKDIWSLFHTFCFDISVWEIWGAFLYGGALVVIPYQISRDPRQFYQLIKNEGVTVLTQTASAFQMFINEDLKFEQKLNSLRYVGFVGESLKVSILRPWVNKYGTGQPRLANLYGITETTVYTNYKFVEQEDINKGRDNIGWPLEEFSMSILDDRNQWCPVGIVGEICIGGRGLSRGYLYRDDLTHERFIVDPYAEYLGLKPGTRLYRTGDLGRWMADGSIEYLGRKDFQVKLRGFRIELGEIEAALGSFEGVTHTVVLLKGEGESAYLSGYFTIKPGVKVDKVELVCHLKSFLPEYMVPAMLTELPSFPMTVNGKIDRAKLHEHEDVQSHQTATLPINSPTQQKIAEVWAKFLNVSIDLIGRNSNFFDLGGNSLLVVNMLGQIKNELGLECSLSRFISLPTIANLADQINGQTNYQQMVHFYCQQLKKDISLDNTIQPLDIKNTQLAQPKTIFLTGATGFLGAYMLAELLKSSQANIICMLRACSQENALAKLISSLKKYQLYQPSNISRVKVVLGDLGLPKLGLSNEDYAYIAYHVDSIIHVGAWVHHVYDYQTLQSVNVDSIHTLLKLAVTTKNKALHFISTLAAGTISPLQRLEVIDANSNEALLSFNGYVATKWVAEQLLKEAHQRGIAAYVYRPGNIIASSINPIYEADNNHTLLRLKGMLQLGMGYVDKAERVEMMPVDCLAKAIVHLAGIQKTFCYNLNNIQTITWIDYLNHARAFGFEFEFVDQSHWNSILASLDENNAFYKLSQFYKVGKTEKFEHQELIDPDYLIDTPSYENLVYQQLRALIDSGFLQQENKFSGSKFAIKGEVHA